MNEFNPDLCKVKAKRLDNEEWVEGFFRPIIHCVYGKHVSTKYWITLENSLSYEIDPNTICKCTGRRDKNGVLVFENDKISFGNSRFIVLYNQKKSRWEYYCFSSSKQYQSIDGIENTEIVGNIHDKEKTT